MSKRIILAISATSLALSLGCSSNKTNTLGSLTYVPENNEEIVIDPLSHKEVREEYKELLTLVEDQHIKEQIERRVADVYMMEGAHDLSQSTATTEQYAEAIKAYRNVLEKYPDSPDNAEVLYQLAKAYDMVGEPDSAIVTLSQLTKKFPRYVNLAEAYFRMGDIYFNNQKYPSAQESYSAVTRYDNERLSVNARYMLGWSYYKQSNFGKSLDEFAVVLDGLLGDATSMDAVSKADQPMATDTIHSISLALDKVGGATAIATMPIVADENYVWMIYDNLGEYYLEKERYENAASTFKLFANTHSNSEKAPTLHNKVINTYIDGGFPTPALKEKESYVEAYGLFSKYEGNKDGIRPDVAASLRTYLDELARNYYNLGKSIDADAKEKAAALAKAKPSDQEQIAKVDPQAIEAFQNAAGFYSQYTETFPTDERIDEVYFLMSESLFLAQQYDDAVAGYERVAYNPTGTSAKEHASNAGYAAIISYQKHISSFPSDSRKAKTWQARAVESMLRFANVFHADGRAVSVLTNAAEYLFSLNEYERALSVSSGLIANNPMLEKALKKTAYGIIAHSHFNLADYHNAELNYIQQRNLISPTTNEYREVSERLATAMYRKSEEMEARGESEATITQLLRVKTLTPNSKLRVPAQFDAATMLIALEQWDRAIIELSELAALFPQHELAPEFSRRLAFSYEKSENWRMAAIGYQGLALHDPDPSIRQEALFLAATMFEKDKDYVEAINHFRDYANTYETPANMVMEARYKLTVNYQRVGDTNKRLFWLDKIVQGARHYESTDRNRWLSAWANTEYGHYYAEKFNNYSLSLPLTKSIPRKNEFLTNASERYQMAAEQGILEFSTMSSFKIADLYRQFADELRRAPRPASLTSEEQSIYNEIIEEQAAPFDQLAVELHQTNIDRAWDGEFNEWIDKSFIAMQTLSPARFGKTEIIVSYGDEIR